MTDLPQVPRRLATTEAPTPGISARDVAAPYASLARAFDNLGGALEREAGAREKIGSALGTASDAVEKKGIEAGEALGPSAVTSDEQGNLRVQLLPPIAGRAGEAFNRTAQMTYLSQLDGKIKETVLAKRLEFDGRPQQFAEWADDYVETLAGGQAREDIARSVSDLAKRHTSTAYQGLALARHNQDVQNNRASLKSSLDSLDNDLGSLAREGGTQSEQYQGRLADYLARQRQAQTDPTLNYPSTKAASDLKDMATRHEVWGIIGQVRRTAEDKTADDAGAPNGGIAKAKELAETILTSRNINLDQESREKYYKVAVAEIKSLATENRVLISQMNSESQSWVKSIREGNVDAAGVRDFMDRAAEAGAVKAVTAVARESATQAWYRDWFTKLPAEDRAAVTLEMSGRKDTRPLIDRIEGVESAGDPNAVPRDPKTGEMRSSATGSGQFTKGTWLGLVKQARPDIAAGKTDDELLALRKDRSLSREMIGAYAQQNAGVLTSQGITPTDRNLYLAHFLGPRDAVAVLSATPETPISGLIWDKSISSNKELFARNSTAGAVVAWAARKMGDSATIPEQIAKADNQTKLSFLSTAQKGLKSDLDTRFSTIEKTVNSGVSPSGDDVAEFGAIVHAVGTPEQKQRAAELGAKAEFGAAYQKADPQQREAMLTTIKERYASGGQKFVGELNEYATNLNNRVTGAYRDDPYGASVQYGQRPALPPAGPDSGVNLQAAFQSRLSEQSLIRDQQGTGAFSVLRPAEASAWKQTLTSGDATAAGGFFFAVRGLPRETRMATLTSKPIAEGVNGMIFSRDPQRMEVGLSAIDSMWRIDPQATESAFGKAAVDRMQVWQGLRDSFSAGEIAERIMTIDDPSRAKAREDLKATAEKETEKVLPADVVGKFVTGIPLLRNVLGGAANAPVDSLTAGQLAAEYKTIRTALRTYGVEPDKADDLALKRLQQTWGVSEANGSQVMKYPPERYYPGIGGSHSWMSEEISKAAEAYAGPRTTSSKRVADVGIAQSVSVDNWKVVGLAPSPNAAARIARGEPPAYTIVIQKANGVLDTVMDPATGSAEFAFNAAPYVEAHVAHLREQERRRKTFRQWPSMDALGNIN